MVRWFCGSFLYDGIRLMQKTIGGVFIALQKRRYGSVGCWLLAVASRGKGSKNSHWRKMEFQQRWKNLREFVGNIIHKRKAYYTFSLAKMAHEKRCNQTRTINHSSGRILTLKTLWRKLVASSMNSFWHCCRKTPIDDFHLVWLVDRGRNPIDARLRNQDSARQEFQ